MTNRLSQSQSLYLRKHAENPIDWWPWCDEALNKAKSQDLPIFVSIGYSSCHWCTVMENEAFSDLAIAEYMNANFLPIKVDREERPDIDSIYMQALQMISGQGGWPLNVFLSPEDLVPFYAGTYFPLSAKYGRPGFLQVLQALRKYYDTEKEDLLKRKATILESLVTYSEFSVSSNTSVAETELLSQGWETNTGIITRNQHGNSFPMIPYANMALAGIRFAFESRYDGKQICTQRGLDLALGGIFDHVGGGFHRYTVDPTWTVPHFEKMLYDNGQIVEYLANLWSTGVQEPAFARAIATTVQWLKREMTAPQGYFYAAQDADNFINADATEPEEGAFYTWGYGELLHLLTEEELTELQQEFTVTVIGNFEGENVLKRRNSQQLSVNLEAALSKLFSDRYGTTAEKLTTFPPATNNQEAKQGNWQGRIPPVTDTKMIVAWNSLMISGLARAYVVFSQSEYLEIAIQATEFILNHQIIAGRLHRLNYGGKPAIIAQSEDYALLIKALLDLHQAVLASGDESSLSAAYCLEKAIAIQGEFNQYLWNEELGGYNNTAYDASQDLIVRERSYLDNATPSANGIAIANLVRLALLTDDLSYLDLAEQGLKAFSSIMSSSPQACPSLFTAGDWYRHSTLVRTTNENINTFISRYLPTTVFVLASDLPTDSIGLVCQGLQCLAPAENTEMMWQQLQQSQKREGVE